MKQYGSATPATRLHRGLTPISKSRQKKCTANLSAFRILTKQSSSPGSRAVRSFVRAAAGSEEMERYSISDPAMNLFRPIISRKFRRLCKMQFVGPHPKALVGLMQFRILKFLRNLFASAKIPRAKALERFSRLLSGEIASLQSSIGC